MTSETVQEVLREMRAWDSMGEQWADRIERALKEMLTMPPSAEYTDAKKLWGYERALAGSEPVAWRYRYYDSSGWTYQQERPNDPPSDNQHGKVIEPLYTHPAIGNKPAVDLSKYRGALVDAAKYSRTDYFHSDLLDLIALIDSAQDGKGE